MYSKHLLFFVTLFSLLFTLFDAQAQPCKQVIGYYPNWQWYDRAHLVNPATINYSKYTVINYAFFAPQDNGTIASTDAWADENLLKGQINWSTTPTSYYPNTSIIDRAHNANVKVVPSIGGWTLSDKFPAIAANPTKRANFAHACIQLCQEYNFDGIDIDWEYPGFAEHLGTTADKQNFTIFLQQIRDSLTTYGTSHNKTMLLTACVGASQANMSNIEWNNISSILNYINLMSYDFFGSWDATANHNSPLYAPAQGDANFNLNSAVQYLINHYGVAPTKINAGTAFYGRSAKTTTTPALFAPISGTDAVTFSEDEGSPLYYNIAKRFNLFSQQFDSQAQVPYLLGVGGLNTFVSYDNAQSIALKAQYIVSNNLAGAIIWEITGDYLETTVGSGVIANTPLVDTLNYVFCNNVLPPTCTVPTTLTATPAATSVSLNWASTGAASYQIQIRPTSSAVWTTTTATTNSKIINSLTACTNYEYKVQSVCSNTLVSGYSTAFGFQTTGCMPTCTIPTTLTATPAATSVSLNWASTGAASYQIQIRPTSSAVWTTTTSTTNSKTINSLIVCTNYEYKVQSVCSNTLASGYSTAIGFQTIGCTPTCTVPTTLTATPAATSVSLNWASTGAASYQIQIRPTSSAVWTTTTATTNSKTINSLTACTNYEYKVQSVCSNALASGYSTAFGFQTTGCTPTCTVPTALTATPAATSVSLNWASTGAASYQIQIRPTSSAVWTTTTATTNSKTINSLTACTNYEYKVQSVCSNTLASGYSTVFGFQTTGCAPTCIVPTTLAATPAATSVSLNWASTGAASYQIQIRPTSSAVWTTTTSTTNSKTINSLTACTNYEYKVQSVCSNALASGYSTAFGFQTTGCTPTCTVPTTLAATPAATSVSLNWASTGAASYQIQIRPTSSAVWTTTTSTTNSKTINSLTACTNYEYKVQSVCSNALASGYSTAFGFETTGCTPTCTVPTTLTATPAATSVSLNWASTGAASYQIQIRPTSSAVWTTTTSTTNSKTINSLTACTNYEYKVRSVCSNTLSSGYSTVFGFQTTGCTPTCTIPTTLTATPAATSVSLNWASTGAASYQVQYKLATATTWINVISNANNCTINGLTACTNYEYKVQSVCNNALASGYSTVFGFQTTGCANTINCLAPTTFYFNNANYIPLGEAKLGQGRLSPVWGVPVDAYIPQNRLTWAISMVHAAHLFRNVAQTDKIPVDFYWATAVKESFGGCDANIIALPTGTPYPLSYQAAATGDGCFQIEGNSAYNELIAEYPQRYPVGQHSALIGGSNFETASLSKAYYDIFTVKYWEINKGWNPSGFFNTATDPNAAVKLMAVAYNRGLWYGSLATVLNTDRANAIVAPSISPYFTDNSYGYDYQNALTKYVLVLGDKLNQVPIAEQTNNSFGSYYNPAVSWADIDGYITKIAPLYPEVNFTTVRAAVQATFNSINAGGTISFRYNLGAVLNTLILNLPADDPSANVATNYGCFEGTPTGGGDTGGGGTPGAPAPNNYCSSYSLNATQEWIQSFSLGTLNNNSGNNNGFGNFADQSTNLTIGSSATVSFAAGYTGTPATEYCTVLIDYNRNGSFADAGETVISTTTNNSNVFSQTINIPSTASQGYARMRVQLKRNASATECDIYSGGEVEDYLVNLVTTSGKNTNNFVVDAMLYPNPGNDVLNINTHLPKNATNTISLVDVFGKTIRTLDVAPNNTGNYITNFNNLGNLPSGIYFVVIRSNNTIINTLKWLKN